MKKMFFDKLHQLAFCQDMLENLRFFCLLGIRTIVNLWSRNKFIIIITFTIVGIVIIIITIIIINTVFLI